MEIKFPRGVEVDIDKVPEDFEEQICPRCKAIMDM